MFGGQLIIPNAPVFRSRYLRAHAIQLRLKKELVLANNEPCYQDPDFRSSAMNFAVGNSNSNKNN